MGNVKPTTSQQTIRVSVTRAYRNRKGEGKEKQRWKRVSCVRRKVHPISKVRWGSPPVSKVRCHSTRAVVLFLLLHSVTLLFTAYCSEASVLASLETELLRCCLLLGCHHHHHSFCTSPLFFFFHFKKRPFTTLRSLVIWQHSPLLLLQ